MSVKENSYRRREDWALGIAAIIITSSLGFAGTQLWNLTNKVSSIEERFVTKDEADRKFATKEEAKELRSEVRAMRSKQDERTPLWETVKSCIYRMKC